MRTGLEVAMLAQSIKGWFTISDFHDLFNQQVGQIHLRSVCRYLQSLEVLGLLEHETGLSKFKQRMHLYRWVGWPEKDWRVWNESIERKLSR
jgi:hypothetical protein